MQFIDLQAQRARMGDRVDEAIRKVLDSGAFIMGPEVRILEEQLANFIGARYGLGCASGTDALQLPLMAWGIGPGDAVFTPSFTFAATAEVVCLIGASPVMVDVLPDSFNIDPDNLEAAICAIKDEGKLRPRAIIAVDLFGQPADYPALRAIARKHDLKLIADSAQSFGATRDERHPISWADVTTTSFYPAKPFGCYGDGGAAFTNDSELQEAMISLRNHGAGEDRYNNVRIGLNSRLDTIQAAVLLEKFAIFPEEIELRNKAAEYYSKGLRGPVYVPELSEGCVSVWAQYTIRTDRRDALALALKDQGIPTAIHYPKPLHQQTAYKDYPQTPGGLPVCDELAAQVISLPMHAYLAREGQDKVIGAIRDFVGN